MAGGAEGLGGGFDLVGFHEDVVGVVGRESEDADAGLGERVEERREDAGEPEVERAVDLERAPARFLFRVPGARPSVQTMESSSGVRVIETKPVALAAQAGNEESADNWQT